MRPWKFACLKRTSSVTNCKEILAELTSRRPDFFEKLMDTELLGKFPQFVEAKSWLRFSKGPATGRYDGAKWMSKLLYYFKIHFNIIFTYTARFSEK
jgi:hypothetical protein